MNKIMLAGLIIVLAVSACGAPPTPTPVPPTLIPVKTATPLPTATATPLPTATPTAVPTPANPGQSLSNAFKALGAAKSFRVKTTITGASANPQDSLLEFVAPDKYHLATKDSAGKDVEMIMIGKTLYAKVAGAKWQKMPSLAGFNADYANAQKLTATMGAQKSVKFLGVEAVDGVPTLVYQYTSTTKAVTKMWIGLTDNLPHRSESEPKPGQNRTSTFYDYNATIAITAPI